MEKKSSNTLVFVLIAIAAALAALAFTVLMSKPKITEFEPDYSTKSLSWKVKLLFFKYTGTETLNASFQAYEKKVINGSTIKIFWESPDNLAVIVVKGGEVVDRKSVNFTSKTIS